MKTWRKSFGKRWLGWTGSDHLIRIIPATDEISGYLYAWLSTDYGLVLSKKHTYGSVVDEIDTNHVGDIKVPLLKDQELQSKINAMVLKANQLRYEAHEKEEAAIKMMNEEVIYKR
jgi:type I restriction enzyme S subunit